MGYDLHITRASDWFDSNNHPITLEEWSQLVAGDSQMEMVGYADAETPDGSVLRYQNEGLAIWTQHPDGIETGWFDYYEGRIVVKNPDEHMIRKMKEIASKLGAKVQGDEGEEY